MQLKASPSGPVFPSASSGRVLTATDSEGNATWQDPASSELLPLKTLFWLDKTTDVPAPHTGSIGSPFADIDEVEASAAVTDASGLCFTPGLYSGVLTKCVAFNGFGKATFPLDTTGFTRWALELNAAAGDDLYYFRNGILASLSGTTTRGIVAEFCGLTGSMSVLGSVTLRGCVTTGNFECPDLTVDCDSILASSPSITCTGTFSQRGGELSQPTVAANDVALRGCTVEAGTFDVVNSFFMSQVEWSGAGPTITIADGGTLTTDQASLQSFYAAGGTITSTGALTRKYLDAWSFSMTVAFPTSGAAEVNAVDLTGSLPADIGTFDIGDGVLITPGNHPPTNGAFGLARVRQTDTISIECIAVGAVTGANVDVDVTLFRKIRDV